jgi:hypothetical protein
VAVAALPRWEEGDGADKWALSVSGWESEGRGGELGRRLGGAHELAGLGVMKRRPAACRMGEWAGWK